MPGASAVAQPAARVALAAVPSALDDSENALQWMSQGNYRSAAQETRRALLEAPNEASLHILAGALLLNTGDWNGALTAFRSAAQCDPGDALALYGEALAELARGHRAESLRLLQKSEEHGGNHSYIVVAMRYVQWLDGAQIAIDGAAMPDILGPAQNALIGMDAVRHRDWSHALQTLIAAQNALPGDPVLQPGGLLMRFDAGIPLDTTAPPLPVDNGLNAPPSREAGLSGDVQFEPEGLSAAVGFVAYEMDGQTLGLVNSPPFLYIWDSRQTTNGSHKLDIVLYNRQGQEIARVSRQIRVANRGQSGIGALAASRWGELRAVLWQSLALQPDRAACAYATGTVYRTMGETQQAREWFIRAAAAQPDYQDTRQQWLACGGTGSAGEALWGGLTTQKVVAFTFDDGPRPGLTEPLLDMLTQEGVTATFFVVGKNVAKYPDLTRKITDAGMEIANHSYTHRNLTKLSADAVAGELMQTQAIVKMVTGKTPRFIRPPGGNWNGAVAAVARSWGLIPCMWTVDVYGSEVIGAQQVADAVLAQVRPGSIVLMHNGKLSTMQALPTILRELRRQGYSFVTVDTLERRLSAAKELARQQLPHWNNVVPHPE